MRLRLRQASGIVVIQVDDEACMGDLDDLVRSALNLPQDSEFALLPAGIYPPKPIDLDSDLTVAQTLKDNDLLTVQDIALSGVQAAGKGPMKKPRKRMTIASVTGDRVLKPKLSPASRSSVSSRREDPVNRVVTLSTLQRGRRRAPRRIQQTTDSADLGQVLVSAASGESGQLNQILRDDFKRAVRFRYEEAEALARLTAAYNHAYSIHRVGTSPSTSSLSSRRALPYKAEVVYNKGPGHRTQAKEIVDILPVEAFIQVLREAVADESGHGREILRPRNLARQSPRIFWSIVQAKGTDFPAIFAEIFPNILDWSWLTERPRELSAKALENKRQQEEMQTAKLNRKKRQKISNIEESKDIIVGSSSTEQSSMKVVDNEVSASEHEAERKIADAVDCHSFATIVPHENFSALVTVIGDEKISSLANAPCNLVMIGRIAVASPDRKPPSLDQLELWIANAQEAVTQIMWRECVCDHNENLRRSLAAIGVHDAASFVREIGSSLSAERIDSLHLRLVSINPLFDSIRIWNRNGRDLIAWIHQLCMGALKLFVWISSNTDEEVSFEQEEFYFGDEIESLQSFLDDLASEGWLLETLIEDARLGAKVLIWADDEEHYLLPGVIVAYLPPTEDEPMALWKVQVDVHQMNALESSSLPKFWFEDLESDEIDAASRRMQV